MKRCIECRERFEGPLWRCPSCGFSPRQLEHVTSFCEPEGSDGFDPDAFDHLAQLEHASFWFRSRSRLIVWALQRYFPHAQRVLELGCGTGFVLQGLCEACPGVSFAGGELHLEGLRHAAERVPTAELFQIDARRLPFESEFDVIGAFDVLEHIEMDERVLREMRTAVKPAGGIVLTVPQHPWLWSPTDEYAEHKRRYRRAELLGKISTAGFTVRRITSFVSLLLPGMAAMRLRTRLAGTQFDAGHEHRAAKRVTGALERVADFERALIGRGMDLPVGGSLLVVATRT